MSPSLLTASASGTDALPGPPSGSCPGGSLPFRHRWSLTASYDSTAWVLLSPSLPPHPPLAPFSLPPFSPPPFLPESCPLPSILVKHKPDPLLLRTCHGSPLSSLESRGPSQGPGVRPPPDAPAQPAPFISSPIISSGFGDGKTRQSQRALSSEGPKLHLVLCCLCLEVLYSS